MYIISNKEETRFLLKNKNQSLSITTNKNQAYKWTTFNKANNIINNLPASLAPNISGWKIICTDATIPVKTICSPSFSPPPNPAPTLREEVSSLKSKLQKELDLTCEQLSHYDKEKEDVLHYIEFNDLNACQGYKIYSLLHEIMQDRRTAKDRILYLQMLIKSLDTTPLPPKKRSYSPRALPTLFDNGI